MVDVWGFHMPTEVGNDPIEHGVVSLGWPDMGDIFALPNSRDAFKQRLTETHPNTKPGAVPVDAGTLYKFVHDMKQSDVGIQITPSYRYDHTSIEVLNPVKIWQSGLR